MLGKFSRKAPRNEIRLAVPPETALTLVDGATKTAGALVHGDTLVLEDGAEIPCDGVVIDGLAVVDESAITGESAPVIRETRSGHEAVTAGTRVRSGRILVRV